MAVPNLTPAEATQLLELARKGASIAPGETSPQVAQLRIAAKRKLQAIVDAGGSAQPCGCDPGAAHVCDQHRNSELGQAIIDAISHLDLDDIARALVIDNVYSAVKPLIR